MSFRPSAHTNFSANDRNGLTRRTVLFGGTGGYRDTGVPERELRRYKVSTSYYRRLVLKLRQKTLNVVFKTQ